MPARAHRKSTSRIAENGRGGIVALAGWSTDGHRLGLWRDATGQSHVVELDWFEDQFRQSGGTTVASPVRAVAAPKVKARKAPRRLVSLVSASPAAGVRR